MPCIPLPKIALPELPAGLTISPPAPPPLPGGQIIPEGACCKLPALNIPPVPRPPIPPAVLGAAMATLNGFIDQVVDYLNNLPIDCPIE
jgi:hypothetical protein